MTQRPTLPSLSALIKRELRFSLQSAATFIVMVFVGYGAYAMMQGHHEVQSLVVGHSLGLVHAASDSEDLLSAEREIHRFFSDLKSSIPVQVEISATLNGRLLARDGMLTGAKIFQSNIERTVTLPSGDSLHIHVGMNHEKVLLNLMPSFVLILGGVYLFFRFLSWRVNRSIQSLTKPLARTASWVGQVSSSLPESARFPDPLPEAHTDEVCVLHQSINALLGEICKLEDHLSETQLDRARLEIAEQVAHNIRSPLVALDLMLERLREPNPEIKATLRQSVQNIREIAQALSLKRDRKPTLASPSITACSPDSVLTDTPRPSSIECLAALIDEVLMEKRIQYRDRTDVEIDFPLTSNTYGQFARIQSTDFRCVLSNLIDNSFEAIQGPGNIVIRLGGNNETVEISVIDTGNGIPSDVLPRLAEKGFSYGKSRGTGLGLYHAKKTVSEWGGSLDIESTANRGTTVRISLPRARTPDGFLHELSLEPNLAIATLDDDPSIHHLWRLRLNNEGALVRGISLYTFISAEHFMEHVHSAREKKNLGLYLVDFELGPDQPSGLEVIERLGIQAQSVLVTSRFRDAAIQDRCIRLGVRILPKWQIGAVPMVWTQLEKFSSIPDLGSSTTAISG